jgi:hypothetical protein
MQFTENTFDEIRILRLSEDPASATLELHANYFTYYWPSHMGPDRFLTYITETQGTESTSLMIDDEVRGLQQLPFPVEDKAIIEGIQEHYLGDIVSLVRFDGPERSWVWQYAPDRRVMQDYDYKTNAFMRNGLIAYAGCASTSSHMSNFQRANVLLRESGADSHLLVEHLNFFEYYLAQWVKH